LSNSFSNLSEAHKACLRLVAKGMSSKEIAQETGLAWQTVDTYLKQANSRIGTSNRREAARAFTAWELSQKSGSPPEAVAGSPVAADDPIQIGTGERARWLRLPPIGGGTNDLSWSQKTISALQVAAIGAAVVVAIALAVAGLFDTLR